MTLRPLVFLLLPLPALAAPVEVAVISAGAEDSSAEVAAQLNDDTYFDFNATVVSVADVTSLADLSAYSVVVMGDSGHSDAGLLEPSFTAVVDAFNQGGGGVVATSWLSHLDNAAVTDAYTPIDQTNGTGTYCSGPTTVAIASTSHPVTDGIATFVDTSSYWEGPGPAESGAVVLATCGSSYNAVTVAEGSRLRGPRAYLGGIYFGAVASYRNTGLRSGPADQLLEQAVAWASGGCEDLDEDGVSSCQNDCDDEDALRFPGSVELCDGIDNDCDDTLPADEVDNDGDGFLVCALDCDDEDATRFPGNAEVCDGVDNDCDEVVPADEIDADEDGVSTCDGDCADDDEARFPGNAEVCNDIDNDCDGTADNGLPTSTYYADGDGDGWGAANDTGSPKCAQPDGTSERGGDCDDANADVFPEAADIPGNGIDEDCDGSDAALPDEGCGCSTGSRGGWMWLMLAPALLLRRRKGLSA